MSGASGRNSLPPAPREREESIRQGMRALLERGPAGTREISRVLRIPEKTVAGHLEHLRRSLSCAGSTLLVTPARCLDCGFVFSKRDRFTAPGRCPLCRSESIEPPLFEVRTPGR